MTDVYKRQVRDVARSGRGSCGERRHIACGSGALDGRCNHGGPRARFVPLLRQGAVPLFDRAAVSHPGDGVRHGRTGCLLYTSRCV